MILTKIETTAKFNGDFTSLLYVYPQKFLCSIW